VNKISKQEREMTFEKKQLKSLEKMKSKTKTPLYFAVIIILILLVDIVDNFTTNIPGNIQKDYIIDFLITNGTFTDYNKAYSFHSGISVISYVIGLITPFYKSLGDKYGRKPLFVISTIGMTIGLFTIMLAPSYFIFMLGTCITTFFLGHDIQILYILEEAPAKHRAKVYSFVKCLGGLSSLLIPVFRTTLMKNQSELWRKVYLVPAIMGVVVIFLVLFFARETEVFTEERYKYLQIPYEERERIKLEEKEKAKEWGIVPAIKYIFKHKQLKTLLIIKCLFDVAILAVQNYNSIMGEFWGMNNDEDITRALYFFPIFYCISLIISGILADKIGRKKTILIFGFITLITFGLFIFFCSQYNNESFKGDVPVIAGIMYGLYLGGYWIGRDYMEIMATEMVPTEIRSSIIGAFSLLVYSGMAIGFGLNAVLPLITGSIWLSSLIITVPTVLVAVILLLIKVKETKGADYSKIVDAE